MKNYILLIKLMLKDMFRRRDKKQIAVFAVLGAVYVILMVGGVLAMYFVGKIAAIAGKGVELITALMFADFLLTVTFGTVAAITHLFLSKDTEFFLSLPVKSSTVFWAKLTIVYLTELALSVGLLLPIMLTAGIAMSLPALFYIIMLPAIISVPFFSMLVITLISMPITYLITFFKKRGMAGSIFVILLFSVVMGLYFWFVYFKMPEATADGEPVDYTGMFDGFTNVSYAFFPIYMLMKFATLTPAFGLSLGKSLLAEAGLFLGIFAALVAVAYFLSRLMYQRSTAKLLEHRSQSGGKKKQHVSGTAFSALLKKEWKEILRNPTVAFQVLAGLVLCPLLVVMVVMGIGSSTQGIATTSEGEAAFDALNMLWPFGIMMLMMMGVGMNTGAATCISREGPCILFLKMLPVEFNTQLKAKHTLYLVLCGATVMTGFIALCIVTAVMGVFKWWAALLLLASLASWAYFMVALCIYFDLKSPKLDWKSIKEIIKRGKNTAIPLIWIFASMAVTGVIFGLVIGTSPFGFADFSLGMGLGVIAAGGAVAAPIMHRILYNSAGRLFENLRE